MLKKAGIIAISVFLSGCSALPGMHPLDTSRMHKQVVLTTVKVEPTLIPITPSLLADKRISTYYYHVAPADVLSISVWRHPEFNFAEVLQNSTALNPGTQGAAGQLGYLVNANGDIYFPLIGYVHVADKTVEAIRVVIANRLKKYVRNPQVNVRVADYRGQKVYMWGEVSKPGFVPITDQPLSITDALTLVGGLDPNSADPTRIYVIRGDLTHPQIYWLDAGSPDALLLAQHFSLQPRDIVYVSTATATRWNRVLNQLIPTLQTVWYTKTITHS